MLTAIGNEIRPADMLITSSLKRRALNQLISRGLVRASGFTPTDAQHVLGGHDSFDAEAALKLATMFARQRDRYGKTIAASPEILSKIVTTALIRRSAEALLAAAFERDGLGEDVATSKLVAAALDRTPTTSRIDIGLGVPVIGLGAPALAYYPAVAELLGAEAIIPADADVANAVGAVVGKIRIVRSVVITAPKRGFFRVHQGEDQPTVTDLDEAKVCASDALVASVSAEMRSAGSLEFELTEHWDESTVVVEGRPLFVEGSLTVTGSGRPDLG